MRIQNFIINRNVGSFAIELKDATDVLRHVLLTAIVGTDPKSSLEAMESRASSLIRIAQLSVLTDVAIIAARSGTTPLRRTETMSGDAFASAFSRVLSTRLSQKGFVLCDDIPEETVRRILSAGAVVALAQNKVIRPLKPALALEASTSVIATSFDIVRGMVAKLLDEQEFPVRMKQSLYVSSADLEQSLRSVSQAIVTVSSEIAWRIAKVRRAIETAEGLVKDTSHHTTTLPPSVHQMLSTANWWFGDRAATAFEVTAVRDLEEDVQALNSAATSDLVQTVSADEFRAMFMLTRHANERGKVVMGRLGYNTSTEAKRAFAYVSDIPAAVKEMALDGTHIVTGVDMKRPPDLVDAILKTTNEGFTTEELLDQLALSADPSPVILTDVDFDDFVACAMAVCTDVSPREVSDVGSGLNFTFAPRYEMPQRLQRDLSLTFSSSDSSILQVADPVLAILYTEAQAAERRITVGEPIAAAALEPGLSFAVQMSEDSEEATMAGWVDCDELVAIRVGPFFIRESDRSRFPSLGKGSISASYTGPLLAPCNIGRASVAPYEADASAAKDMIGEDASALDIVYVTSLKHLLDIPNAAIKMHVPRHETSGLEWKALVRSIYDSAMENIAVTHADQTGVGVATLSLMEAQNAVTAYGDQSMPNAFDVARVDNAGQPVAAFPRLRALAGPESRRSERLLQREDRVRLTAAFRAGRNPSAQALMGRALTDAAAEDVIERLVVDPAIARIVGRIYAAASLPGGSVADFLVARNYVTVAVAVYTAVAASLGLTTLSSAVAGRVRDPAVIARFAVRTVGRRLA